MLETHYSSGHGIDKALAFFPGFSIRGIPWPVNRDQLRISDGFHLLSRNHSLVEAFGERQVEYGYEDKYGTYILYTYKKREYIDSYDDPLEKFIALSLAFSLSNKEKVYPLETAKNDLGEVVAFRLRIHEGGVGLCGDESTPEQAFEWSADAMGTAEVPIYTNNADLDCSILVEVRRGKLLIRVDQPAAPNPFLS